MWCESSNTNIQKACKIITSEEVKRFVCIVALFLIIVNILDLLRYPVRKVFNFVKKKVNNLRRMKKLIPRVP